MYLTGTRADYGLMRHCLLTLNKLCDLQVVVTGMHLEKKFGHTIDEIKKDKLRIVKEIETPSKTDSISDLPENLGYLLKQLNRLIKRQRPNYVLVEGDRVEALALAIAANCHNIPVIHQGGGDISGSVDAHIRDAVTGFSNYHLAGNAGSGKRLKAMATDKGKVFMFGEPGLDDITGKRFLPLLEVYRKFGLVKDEPLILAVQHPDTKEMANPKEQIRPLLQAISKLKIPTVIIYPNNDPGGKQMIAEINKYRMSPFVRIFPSLPRTDFLGLMNVCSIMVGNSSSGLVETPLFNLPFINIGNRQKDRLADTNTVSCYNNEVEIISKIRNNINKKGTFTPHFVYGHGHFTEKFVNLLKKI
jgi:UDP-hydrolysing UDP-N-acetyl-D-glucosamine 2-epimerase